MGKEEFEIPFPFTPYEPQKRLMRCLYNALENEGVAILSSPTGTGKSLSIICSALHWLLNHEKQSKNNCNNNDSIENKPSNNDNTYQVPSWMDEFFENREKQKQVCILSILTTVMFLFLFFFVCVFVLY